MPLVSYKGKHPALEPNVFVAPDAWITGDVHVQEGVTVLFGAVIRGDIQPIKIGRHSNVQEHGVIHTSRGLGPCEVGQGVTIGHHAVLHGCTVGDYCIIGMGTVVLDSARIGRHCLIGAQSLVPMGMEIPEGSLAFGVPAKVIRRLTEKEIEECHASAEAYRKVGAEYAKSFTR